MYPITLSASSASVTLVPIPKLRLLLHLPCSLRIPSHWDMATGIVAPTLCPWIILYSTKKFLFLKDDPATHPVCMLGGLWARSFLIGFYSRKNTWKSLHSIQPLNVLNTEPEKDTPNAQESEVRPTVRTGWNWKQNLNPSANVLCTKPWASSMVKQTWHLSALQRASDLSISFDTSTQTM